MTVTDFNDRQEMERSLIASCITQSFGTSFHGATSPPSTVLAEILLLATTTSLIEITFLLLRCAYMEQYNSGRKIREQNLLES
jgi:hypothetical protein